MTGYRSSAKTSSIKARNVSLEARPCKAGDAESDDASAPKRGQHMLAQGLSPGVGKENRFEFRRDGQFLTRLAVLGGFGMTRFEFWGLS